MEKLVDLGPMLRDRRGSHLFDDFFYYRDADTWTLFKSAVGGESVALDTGATAGSGVNGIMTIQTGGTANNYAGFSTTVKPFEIRDNDPIIFECRLNYAEANTNNALIAVGLTDGTFHSVLQNGTAGPATSFTGAILYKVSGDTTWSACTSQGTTQSIDHSTALSTPVTSDQILRIELRPAQGTGGTLEVNYWIQDVEAINSNAQVIPPKPIKHRIAYTAPVANMAAGVVVLAGGNFNEIVRVDYIACDQLRGVAW